MTERYIAKTICLNCNTTNEVPIPKGTPKKDYFEQYKILCIECENRIGYTDSPIMKRLGL